METFVHGVLKNNLDYFCFVALNLVLFLCLLMLVRRKWRAVLPDKSQRKRRECKLGPLPYVAASLFLVLLGFGWYFVNAAGEREYERDKNIVSGIAPTFAYQLENMGHESLNILTPPNDSNYRTIVQTVSKWMSINPDIERIYTVKKGPTGNDLYMVSSEGKKGIMHRPIGAPYLVQPQYEEGLKQAFQGVESFAEDTTAGSVGAKTTAFEPIVDSMGQPEAVLGIDYNTVSWQRQVLGARRNGMAFLLVLLVPLYTTFLVLFQTRLEKYRMKRHQEELLESENRFKNLSNATFEGLVVVTDNRIVEANNAAAQMFGYTQEELLAIDVLQLCPPGKYERIRRSLMTDDNISYEASGLRKDGTEFALEIVGTTCSYKGQWARVFAVRDITERKRAEATINHMAYHDMLTGLPNRVLFNERLSVSLMNAREHGGMLAVLFLDLDRFKLVNDTLGHTMGDRLLRGVAQRLHECLREDDIVARMGGDEFTVLLSHVTDPEEAAAVSREIIAALSRPFLIDEYELHTTTSIGIGIYPQDGEDVQMLMKNADTAMYRAKDQGRNNYSFYSPAMNMRGIERLELENDLRYALERDQFVVFYQPRVNISTGQIIGMEALVRWKHPRLGLVPPNRFIPLAEETGLIIPIGEWVLRTACKQNKSWQNAGYSPLQVAVNLSARQFQSQGLVEMVAEALEESGLGPEYLELEITESITMHDVDFTIQVLEELSRMGIQISIDDFGTGYSSLNYLKRFPIHTLKIDQSFVREITIDPYNAAIVTTVIYLAQNLKLKVIAEGVETVEQLDYLRDHQCDEMQGYLFSRPVPADEFERMLAEQPLAKM